MLCLSTGVVPQEECFHISLTPLFPVLRKEESNRRENGHTSPKDSLGGSNAQKEYSSVSISGWRN